MRNFIISISRKNHFIKSEWIPNTFGAWVTWGSSKSDQEMVYSSSILGISLLAVATQSNLLLNCPNKDQRIMGTPPQQKMVLTGLLLPMLEMQHFHFHHHQKWLILCISRQRCQTQQKLPWKVRTKAFVYRMAFKYQGSSSLSGSPGATITEVAGTGSDGYC